MVREIRLFLGNPGTGKSTLINCLIGEHRLQSGLSYGGGLTKGSHRVEHDGVAYMDTPGLADGTIAEEAAIAITEALRQGGRYKLFFMMRLQNGRVVSEDMVTLERVLSSLDMDVSKIRYSIVFNAVDKAQFALLSQPESEELASIKRVVNGRRFQTDAFCIIPELKPLFEASNAVAALPQQVFDFMDEVARSMRIDPRAVRPIDPRGFEAQTREVQKEMEQMRMEKTAMLAALASGEPRHVAAPLRQPAPSPGRFSNAPRRKPAPEPHGSPTHNYVYSPQTPLVEDERPGSVLLIRKKTLLIAGVVIIVVFAVSIALVATLKGSKSNNVDLSTPPAPTPAPPNEGSRSGDANAPTVTPTVTPTAAPTVTPTVTPTTTTKKLQPASCAMQDKLGAKPEPTDTTATSIEQLVERAAARKKPYFAIKGNNYTQFAFLDELPNEIDRKDCTSDANLWSIYKTDGNTTPRTQV